MNYIELKKKELQRAIDEENAYNTLFKKEKKEDEEIEKIIDLYNLRGE